MEESTLGSVVGVQKIGYVKGLIGLLVQPHGGGYSFFTNS